MCDLCPLVINVPLHLQDATINIMKLGNYASELLLPLAMQHLHGILEDFTLLKIMAS